MWQEIIVFLLFASVLIGLGFRFFNKSSKSDQLGCGCTKCDSNKNIGKEIKKFS